MSQSSIVVALPISHIIVITSIVIIVTSSTIFIISISISIYIIVIRILSAIVVVMLVMLLSWKIVLLCFPWLALEPDSDQDEDAPSDDAAAAWTGDRLAIKGLAHLFLGCLIPAPSWKQGSGGFGAFLPARTMGFWILSHSHAVFL